MAEFRGAVADERLAGVELSEVAPEPPPLHFPPMHPDRDGPPPPGEHRWAYQPCWRGQRALVHLHGALTNLHIFPPVRVLDPGGRDLSESLPELAMMADAGPPTAAILDVIISLPPEQLVPDDHARAQLLYRLERTLPEIAVERSLDQPLHVLVLDLVHLDRRRVADLPYTHRRALLLDRLPDGPHWEVPPHWLRPDRHLADAAQHWHTDEIIAKRLDSRYFPGMLSPVWRRATLAAFGLR